MRKSWVVGPVVGSIVCALVGLGIGAASGSEQGPATKPEAKQCVCHQKVVRHVVSFKFKDTASAEQIQNVCDEFVKLKAKIPFMLALEWGTNISPEDLSKGFTHCFLLTFKNQEDLKAYFPHPEHDAFRKVLRPVLDDVFVIDYETTPGCCCGQCGSGGQSCCETKSSSG